jgi:hypothetical protein
MHSFSDATCRTRESRRQRRTVRELTTCRQCVRHEGSTECRAFFFVLETAKAGFSPQRRAFSCQKERILIVYVADSVYDNYVRVKVEKFGLFTHRGGRGIS